MVWQNILLRESVPKSWYTTNNTIDESVDLKDPQVINVRRFKILLSEIPPALMPVLQGIIKVSVNRRPTSTSHLSLFQRSERVAENIAEIFRDNLAYMRLDDPICKYDYYASMFSMISMLLLDDRSRTALETPIAVAFERIGNVDLLADTLLSEFWKAAESQIEKDQQCEDGTDLQRMNTCIELLLAILHHLGSSKLFHNSPHTTILTTLDPEDNFGNTSLLNPHHWMARMQYKLSGLYLYLESPYLHKFSRHVLHSLLRCITQNMKAEGERPRHGLKPLRGSKEDDPEYQTNRSVLVDMGFDADLVDTTLSRFDGNGICALDNLFSRRLVEHPVGSGPPTLDITPELQCSNPLTEQEFAAGVRILVNMWYDQTLATEALRENNNLAQAALSLSRYEPTAIRTPSLTEFSNTVAASVTENDDDEYEDIETGDEEEEENLEHEEDLDQAEADRFCNIQLTSKKAATEILHRLDAVRETMRSKIPQILARLVDERSDIDFEVRDLMVVLCCGDSNKLSENTKQSIRLFFGENHNTDTDKRAMFESSINKIRIFALMLREPAMQDVMSLLITTMSEFMDWFDFLDLIVTYPDLPDPKWLTTLFLILEAGLAQADEPKEEPLPDLNTSSQDKPAPVTVTAANRTTLMNYCITLLKMESLSQDNLISTLRILVRLTKHHDAAAQFVTLGGLDPLFKRPSKSFEVIKIQQAYIIMILRHIIEDKSVLMNCMREWLSFWFTAPPSRYLDVATYIRNNNSIALRDPDTFVDVSSQICRLSNFKSGNIKNIRYIGLQQVQVENTGDPYSPIVIHFLLNQLVFTLAEKDESNIKIGFTGFILQCLLELISSYPMCKHDIVVFNNQVLDTTSESGLSNHARIRQSILFTLVNRLLPFNAINPTTDQERKRQGISMCVASLLVAMCYDTTHVSTTSIKEDHTPEEALTEIRKHVLDVVYRSFKDALQSGTSSTSAKYIRYFALAELCHRILNARPPSISPAAAAAQSNTKEDTVLVVAKLMLEKKFVPVLISVISDVDVNYPHAKMILNSILRPLEQLTKLAIRIDRSSPEEEKKTQDKKEDDEHDIYLPMDTDEDNDAAEEEVSDLYRNSSLAMYDGTVLEEESSEESSDDDIEMAR